MKPAAIFLLVLLTTLMPPSGAQQNNLPNVIRKLSPAVVTIRGTTAEGDTVGTGFIVSPDGKIATNVHVIASLQSGVVILPNGERFANFTVLGFDPVRDLALIKIPGFGLPTVELGNSNDIQVGESTIAMGSARGLQGTVTTGIVSAIRTLDAGYNVIQTDASINPGNSGGPLTNTKGQVIGVIVSKLRGSENLNFAVPINQMRGLLADANSPISLQEFRQKLASSAKYETVASTANFPKRWRSVKTPMRATMRVAGDYVYLEADIPDQPRRDGAMNLAELRKEGGGYKGKQRVSHPCVRQNQGVREVKICRYEFDLEFKSLDANRIDARTYAPVIGQTFDCNTCSWPQGFEWRETALIPE